LDRALVSSYRLSIVTMSLTAAVWPQFATQVFRGGIGRLTFIWSNVNKQVTTFTFRVQATTCSKHDTRTVMDAGCECAPWVRLANPSDSWALLLSVFFSWSCGHSLHYHYLLPRPDRASQRYNLRPTSSHNRQLPTRARHLTDADFITRQFQYRSCY